jgi:hypothetical protein
MKLVTHLIAMVALTVALSAFADKPDAPKDKANMKDRMERSADDVEDRYQDKTKSKVKERNRYEETYTKEKNADKDKDKAKMDKVGKRDEDDYDQDRRERMDSDGREAGNEKSREMRTRSEERKAIKEEYKADVEAGGERIKGKKPWWKFWGSEDA